MPGCEGMTPRAHRLLARVRAEAGGETFAFMISGGCCGGTNPVLCRRSSIIEGFDLRLGEAGGIAEPQVEAFDDARAAAEDGVGAPAAAAADHEGEGLA